MPADSPVPGTPTDEAVVYLYPQGSYGRRHIADPLAPRPVYGGKEWRRAHCSAHFRTDEAMSAALRRWHTSDVAEAWIAKRRGMPVCKTCQRAHDRRSNGA